MALDRLPRVALTATLAVSMAGCALVTDPGALGPCELVVRSWDGRNEEILEQPYTAAMYVRSSGVQEVPIILHGSGWGTTRIDMAGPGKSVSTTFDADTMNADTTWFATAPGTWHFRLTAGPCARVFDVEVKPAP